jgi:pectate lyase-like protein
MQSHINRRAILAGAVSLPAISNPNIAATTQVAQGPAGSRSDPGPIGPLGPPARRGGTFSAGIEGKNVTDYGAKGNGIDDDRAAFIKAMNEAKGSARGLIRIPIGRYKISAPIPLASHQAVTFRGDAIDALRFGAAGSGSALAGSFDKGYIFTSSECNNISWEYLGFYGWGGIYLNNGRQIEIRNCHFGVYRGFICPELWTAHICNNDFAGDNSPGSVGIYVHPDGAMLYGNQVTGFDRGVVLSGNGVDMAGFRMEVGNYGIVLGQDLDGNKKFLNASSIRCGTMEANDHNIWIENAAFCNLSNIWIQGHEHPGFGSDEMCEGGIYVNNCSNVKLEGLRVGGGFANAALVDVGGLQYNNKYERCSFDTNLTARDDVAPGATVIKFARGRMTSMPRWLKVGLLVQDTAANGNSFAYVDSSPGAFAPGTTVAAIGTDTITLSKRTVGPIAGMFLDPASRVMTGRSSIGFYDARKIHVGGVYMSNPSANLVEQSTPLDVA